jgi:hypothetical protein
MENLVTKENLLVVEKVVAINIRTEKGSPTQRQNVPATVMSLNLVTVTSMTTASVQNHAAVGAGSGISPGRVVVRGRSAIVLSLAAALDQCVNVPLS